MHGKVVRGAAKPIVHATAVERTPVAVVAEKVDVLPLAVAHYLGSAVAGHKAAARCDALLAASAGEVECSHRLRRQLADCVT